MRELIKVPDPILRKKCRPVGNFNKAYFDDGQGITLYYKDSRDMCEVEDESVDLIPTDPPYGISFMGKDWDTFNEIVEPQGAYQHKKGFKKLPRQNTVSMTEFFAPIWRECLRVLKPGAFAFVMCSPRADVMSKQVSCLQDAGFVVNFTPIFWTYASGFPKAQNIGKAVDKKLGINREVIGSRHRNVKPYDDSVGWNQNETQGDYAYTKAQSPQAKALDGSYGGFQPKPAVEVIIVAMKPLSEKTYLDQALKNQKGIMWLDDGRIPYENQREKAESQEKQSDYRGGFHGENTGIYQTSNQIGYKEPSGRFPANLLVSDDVLNDGRVTKSTGGKSGHTGAYSGGYKEEYYGDMKPGLGDSGSFSRYFDLDKWWEERIKHLPESAQRTFPFLIVPKASKSEKNKGCEDLPQLVVSGETNEFGKMGINTPEMGEKRGVKKELPRYGNPHPTVKPLKLMSYLIVLGSREGDMVVDPFIGTGSTAIACQILGRHCTGYEIKPEYCEIAKRRLSIYRQRVMSL